MVCLSRVSLSLVTIGVLATTVLAGNQQPAAPQNGKSDRAALEKAFSEKLSEAALVGTFSIAGNNDKPPRPERYELLNVTKLKGRDDYWIFTARIKYGQTDVKVPITLKVLWAGDTPVITLTDFTIPGLGTFTARVMFYGDRYAGTWQHGKAGGHMWGRIEKIEKPKAGDSKPYPNFESSPKKSTI